MRPGERDDREQGSGADTSAWLPVLRERARRAVEALARALLDDARNRPVLEGLGAETRAKRLFEVALRTVHHLLFQLAQEARSSGDAQTVFNSGPFPRRHVEDGLSLDEASVQSARELLRGEEGGGGSGRGPAAAEKGAPAGGERARAKRAGGKNGAVDLAALSVEDLGRVHEGLVALSPGIATEPMCRLRRRALEVVVPLPRAPAEGRREVLPEGSFYLRAGLGRKTSGSYYTPRAFVRFLVRETLGPHVESRSPAHSPDPEALLGIRVLDPAMGTGCFLVEACRFLGDALTGAWARAGRLEEIRRAHGDPALHARRLVARECLYGVDRDPLAVEVARLALRLESGGDLAPDGAAEPTCAADGSAALLAGRLICGDALTAPFFADLLTWPRAPSAPLPGGLAAALERGVDRALAGDDPAAALTPFRCLAAAWSGAVMLGASLDADYLALVEAVSRGGATGGVLRARPGLARAAEVGSQGVSFDLTFPHVFWRRGRTSEAGGGFSAVVGNPPWEAVRRNDDQFFSAFDLGLRDLPTRADKRRRIDALSRDPPIEAALSMYLDTIERKDHIVDALYRVHRARVAGGLAGRGTYDDYMLFAERAAAVIEPGTGRVGLLLPSAFHASEGASGVRRLYLRELRLDICFSFENRRRLFEIDGRFKFAVVVASARPGAAERGESRADPGPPARETARVAFYLHDPEWLSGPDRALRYDAAFIERTGGEHLTLPELRSAADVRVVEACHDAGETFGAARGRLRVATSQELNMTYAADLFTPAETVLPPGADAREPAVHAQLVQRGYLPLHEGKTFHQYTDRWESGPRYLVALDALRDRPRAPRAARFYRLAFRDIASSTNERTGIFCLLPPGVLCSNKAPCERAPFARPDAASLTLLAIANSFPFDHLLRTRVQSTVNLFLLDACPVPGRALEPPRARFLAHAALRLSCNHEGYLPLWRAQLGGEWRESSPVYTWPVLADWDERRATRAAVDAVVAEAYGLSRSDYAHVLSSFRHRSWPDAPVRCLAAYDRLERAGFEAFSRAHDPYSDLALVETPPEPVIELPHPGSGAPRGERVTRGGRGGARRP